MLSLDINNSLYTPVTTHVFTVPIPSIAVTVGCFQAAEAIHTQYNMHNDWNICWRCAFLIDQLTAFVTTEHVNKINMFTLEMREWTWMAVTWHTKVKNTRWLIKPALGFFFTEILFNYRWDVSKEYYPNDTPSLFWQLHLALPRYLKLQLTQEAYLPQWWCNN